MGKEGNPPGYPYRGNPPGYPAKPNPVGYPTTLPGCLRATRPDPWVGFTATRPDPPRYGAGRVAGLQSRVYKSTYT